MKVRQGTGRKGRLRRKHRRDIAFHKPLAGLPQSAAGAGSESFGGIAEPPARVRERYAPHDCKQDDFSSGTLRSQNIFNIPALWPSTNLEMILKY